jgi:thiamine transport system permease protein
MNGLQWSVNNNQPSAHWLAPLAVLAAAALGLVPLIVFAISQGGTFALDARVLHVTRFTLWQATLSTALSVIPAIPLARALARQQFWGREFLLSLFAVPQSLPVIVAVLAVVSLYGASGMFGGWFPVYGLAGIVLTHVFFNLPLATLMMHRALSAIPTENHRLAAQLGFGEAATFKHVDWPALKPAIPRIAALIFLLCAASFVTVLTLGGPAATTLEVAIYQSLRADFDVARAISLSAVQVVLSLALVLLLTKLAAPVIVAQRLRTSGERLDGQNRFARAADITALVLASLLFLPPLASMLLSGISHFTFSTLLIQALATSLLIAVFSAAIVLLLSWSLARLQHSGGISAKLATAAAFMGLILPPAVMATGWYLAVRILPGDVWLAITLIVCLNVLMALPFATSVLVSGFATLGETHEMLCQSLGLSGFDRLRVIDIPALKPVILQALLLAFAMSFGDLTAVTLLGAQGLVTLPSLVAEQMGHFQSREAGGTALLLAALCLTASWFSQRAGRQT